MEPAEDVVHDRFGVSDFGSLAPAAGFKARVRELLAQHLERHAMLQRQRDRAGKAVHQARDRGPFFGHGHEDFARTSVRIKSDGDVALMASHFEFVGDRRPLFLAADAEPPAEAQ